MIDTDLLLALGASYKKVSAGETIFREGTHALFYHQLVAGKVCWSNFKADGKEILQELIFPGESFGELPLFDGEPYACTATALTDCVLLRLGFTSFLKLLGDHPEISLAFNRLFTQRLRFKLFLMKELAGHSPEQSVSGLLKYLSGHSDKVCKECHKLLLTRQQIANLTGMRVETVIRAIKGLENKGALRIVKGKVILGQNPGMHCASSR